MRQIQPQQQQDRPHPSEEPSCHRHLRSCGVNNARVPLATQKKKKRRTEEGLLDGPQLQQKGGGADDDRLFDAAAAAVLLSMMASRSGEIDLREGE
ncbi:hypothetical protein PRIPAC_79504 [Pristionchus pacificus]|uniref:Uncharacterized protein n=1 Tax=Pristionchus pacificus TaxID=54126 RepID=A0A2A6CBW6_PRIPA|nr:hypothetical protein PRIPAC_79504 [Pristionchus pacificus]|eukprot:PDM75590.1 hypothetical protein PRIPAC_42767 [Pristionchus pacificus]